MFQETCLPDGSLALTHTMPHMQTVALGVFVDVGSRDESLEQAGMAHALEHMLFKGTEHDDVHALSEKLDALGGNANAFTSRERTCFHIQVLHDDWQQGLTVLLDMLQKPALPEEEWQREREVIFSEMSMVEDAPDEWMFDQHMMGAFPGQAFGRPTLGAEASLAAWNVNDLRQYLESHYRPPRILVTACGNIEHQALVDALAQRSWGASVPAATRKQPVFSTQTQWFTRNTEQVQIAASWPGIVTASSERPLAWLANQLLGVGMSSSLFREVREKRGLAYGVGSHLSTYTDTGLWTVSCATAPHLLESCMHVLLDTMRGFPQSLDAAALQRAKRQLEVQLRMGMDSVEGYMLYMGGRLDEPSLRSQAEWAASIQEVSLEALQDWVQASLEQAVKWTLLGPEDALQPVQKML